MKRAKRLYLWSGILIVACIVTIGIMRLEEYTEQIKESGEVVLSVSSDTVETLSWENEDGTFSFYLSEGEWIYEEDEAFPVDEEIIDEMLEIFEELRAAFIIEEVEDYSQYGLDDPVCTITFTASELTYEVQLGSYSQLDEQRYVTYNDFRHLELYTAEFTDITGMEVVIDEETYMITSELVDDERVYAYLDEEIDTGDIEDAIENLQADSFTEEEPTEESEIAITLYLENENYSEIEIELFRQDGEYCIASINGESVALIERALMVDLVEAINAIVL